MRLKRNICLVFLNITIFGFAAGICAAPDSPPDAEVPELVFTHPPVVEDDVVLHEFKIRNKGGSELRIPKVKAD